MPSRLSNRSSLCTWRRSVSDSTPSMSKMTARITRRRSAPPVRELLVQVVETEDDGDRRGRDETGGGEQLGRAEAVGEAAHHAAHAAHAGEHLHDQHAEQAEDDPETQAGQ